MKSPLLSVGEIAAMVSGTVEGDSGRKISAIQPLDIAREQDLSFYAPKTKRVAGDLRRQAAAGRAGAVLVASFEPEFPVTQIIVPNPFGAVIRLAHVFKPKFPAYEGIHPSAIVDPSASIGENVAIGPLAVVGPDAVLEDNVVLHPHVVIYPGAVIGKGCVIHSGAVVREGTKLGEGCLIQNGAVIGGDGFGYIPDPNIGHRHIPHIGITVLEDRVDMGANSTVDRAMLGETRVRRDTKIDNLVMIGHNCSIGERVIMCSQVGISGSCTVGNDVILAGQVGVADHLTIADRVKAAGQAGITSSVEEPGLAVAGLPQVPVTQWHRCATLLGRLPELFARVKRLEKTRSAEMEEGSES